MAEKSDRLIRFLLPKAHTRGAIIRAENIVNDAARIHGLSAAPAELFGKALIASILLLSVSKGGVRQVLQFDALPEQIQAPVRKMLAEARAGMVRGYLNWGESGVQARKSDEPVISAWMGSPVRTSVLRDLGIGQPYVSTIEHDSNYMADHILYFLTQSAQIQSDLILCGNLGILLEAMPGIDQDHWFRAVETLAEISDTQLDDHTPEALLEHFTSLGCKIVGEDSYTYHCSCSLETMTAALHNIPAKQLRELADEQGYVTLACEYCNRSRKLDIHAYKN